MHIGKQPKKYSKINKILQNRKKIIINMILIITIKNKVPKIVPKF
jgi:hypothetical protein